MVLRDCGPGNRTIIVRAASHDGGTRPTVVERLHPARAERTWRLPDRRRNCFPARFRLRQAAGRRAPRGTAKNRILAAEESAAFGSFNGRRPHAGCQVDKRPAPRPAAASLDSCIAATIVVLGAAVLVLALNRSTDTDARHERDVSSIAGEKPKTAPAVNANVDARPRASNTTGQEPNLDRRPSREDAGNSVAKLPPPAE